MLKNVIWRNKDSFSTYSTVLRTRILYYRIAREKLSCEIVSAVTLRRKKNLPHLVQRTSGNHSSTLLEISVPNPLWTLFRVLPFPVLLRGAEKGIAPFLQERPPRQADRPTFPSFAPGLRTPISPVFPIASPPLLARD